MFIVLDAVPLNVDYTYNGVQWIALHFANRVRIFKLLRSPRIDSKETIPPGCVALRAGTTTLFLLGFLVPIDCLKIPAQST